MNMRLACCCARCYNRRVVRYWRTWALAVLLVAAALRLYGLDWDGSIGAHPDERYLVGAAESLRCPDRLNPFDVAPNLAYGHLPLYLLAIFPGADLLLVGRTLAALFDVGTVAFTLALGQRVYGGQTQRLTPGLLMLAAAFVALMPLHVQQAHFYTADMPLAFFVMGTLFFTTRLAEYGRARDAWFAGLWAGLALGCKFNAVLLLLPVGVACALSPLGWGARWRRILMGGAATLATFALTNPFALLAFSTFWRNVIEQAAIARGALDMPYTRQFHGTLPYLYPILQQLRWGMGWPLGLLCFGGLGYAVWQAVSRPPRPTEWVLLAWALPFFAFTGGLCTKYPRYLLPLTPVLAIYAAALLLALLRIGRTALARQPPLKQGARFLVLLSCSLAPLSLLFSALLSLVLVASYRHPHPWIAASVWLREHIAPGSVIAVEAWDHPLPLDATGYDVRVLPVFDEDTPEKWATIEAMLAETDVVVIASQRGYGILARWPERYPLMAQYYRRLFAGKLGFRPAACFERELRLGPLALVDDPAAGLDFSLPDLCRSDAPFVLHPGRLDESFVVYDHPQVVIFGDGS